MAVYTPLTEDDVREYLAHYALGKLVSFQGIAEGVENSNFLLNTERGTFILTLFEKRTRAEDLPYFMALMAHFAACGIHCPQPVAANNGEVLGALCGRPAVIITFMEGLGVKLPSLAHMPALGECVARMHLAAADFPHTRTNALSLAGWRVLAEAIGAQAKRISLHLAGWIAQELNYLQIHWPQGLPSGAVHADLFPDNVFFKQDALTGVIDFYFACNDAYAYDLAIVINAWCFDADHRFQSERVAALLETYQQTRPLSPQEKQALPVLCRGAALRFLLTRANDLLFHPEGALVTPKDPKEYIAKLQFFQTWAGL